MSNPKSPNLTPRKHPLNGQYIAYIYTHHEYGDEQSRLAVYKLQNKNMKEIYHPLNGLGIIDVTLDEIINIMHKKKIRKVYSVFHLDDFFGIPAHWIDLSDKKEETESNYWCEYKRIEEDSDEYPRLKENGIEVLFYEEPRKT